MKIPEIETNLPKRKGGWDKNNPKGLLWIVAISVFLILCNQLYRSYDAKALQERAQELGLLIPSYWNYKWDDPGVREADEDFLELESLAASQNLRILPGELSFPYYAVELVRWDIKLDQFEEGLQLQEQAIKLGFTEFPGLHLPQNPQKSPSYSLRIWKEIIADTSRNLPAVEKLQSEAKELGISTEIWIPPFNAKKINNWGMGKWLGNGWNGCRKDGG